ncbi:hypothetical protein [Natronorubrum sp. FCH18a]|uniref:hypothetical protein n=1 Tax=Natronorubrum sp. FCH18a TaxID=3447018 RepID=UPI003F5145D5
MIGGEWAPVFSLLGLISGVLGSLLIVFPRVKLVEEWFLNTGRISSIEEGRRVILDESELLKGDYGFSETKRILNRDWDIDKEIIKIRAFPFGGFGGGGFVKVYDSEDIVKQSSIAVSEDKKRRVRGEKVGSIPVIDLHMYQEIEHVREEFRNVFFIIGICLILFGFLLQSVSQYLQYF